MQHGKKWNGKTLCYNQLDGERVSNKLSHRNQVACKSQSSYANLCLIILSPTYQSAQVDQTSKWHPLHTMI